MPVVQCTEDGEQLLINGERVGPYQVEAIEPQGEIQGGTTCFRAYEAEIPEMYEDILHTLEPGEEFQYERL